MFRPVPRTWLVLDIVGAVFGVLLTLPMSLAFAVESPSMWVHPAWLSVTLHILIAIVMWGAAAISRLSPALALIIAWGAAIVQMAAGLPPAAYNIAIFGVLFGTAAWGSQRLLWMGGASTLLGGILAGFYIAVVQFDASSVVAPAPPELRVVLLALLLGITIGFALVISWGAGLLWRLVRHGQQTREAQLRAETLAAEEQERVSIARDMHDVVAHSLAVVIAQADGARYAAVAAPELAQEALGTIATTARSALSDVRMLLTQLRHRQGDGPQPTLADLETLFAQVRHAGVEPRVTVDPMPPGEPPGAIQLAVYRILQEALTNALRHGTGDVDVHLAWLADRVEIRVRNSIRTPLPPRAVAMARTGAIPQAVGAGHAGHGLVGMRERAQLVGGTLVAGADAGVFTVSATLPIGPQRSAADSAR